jgi:hypothetical protein
MMILSIFAMEFLRAMVESPYQLLVLRLRLLPIYAVVGVSVYLVSLIALKTVERRDVELLHNYLPTRLRWIAGLLSQIARPRS